LKPQRKIEGGSCDEDWRSRQGGDLWSLARFGLDMRSQPDQLTTHINVDDEAMTEDGNLELSWAILALQAKCVGTPGEVRSALRLAEERGAKEMHEKSMKRKLPAPSEVCWCVRRSATRTSPTGITPVDWCNFQ
jgi:hypothetical protein